MRFTCEKANLVQGLNIASRTAAQKSALKVLEGVLCRAAAGISLTGYNMETAISFNVDADVVEGGECVLPKLFFDIVRRMPEGPVTVVVDESSYAISIRAGSASFQISGESADEYPDLPNVGDTKPIRIPQLVMKELIDSTIFAVSENKARPIHTGVKFEVEPNSMSAIAVDGYRLSRRTYHPAEPIPRTVNFVVPSSGLKEIEKILADPDHDVLLTLGNRHILFQVGKATLVCRLLDGEFLDWRKVVPTDCPVKLVANVHDLMSSVERMGLVVSEKYKSPARCTFSHNVMHMRTGTAIGVAEDSCALAGDGQELQIGFNVRYLLEALRAVPTEEVTLELTNNLSPIVMTPVDDKHDFSYMILPVRIKAN